MSEGRGGAVGAARRQAAAEDAGAQSVAPDGGQERDREAGARGSRQAGRPPEELGFREVATELADFYDEWKRLERRAKVLKDYLHQTYAGEVLDRVGNSLFLDLPEVGRTVRLTEPEPTETLNPERFRALVDDDELFLRLVRVKAVELDVSAWLEEVRAERFSETDLLDCVDTSERAPSVTVVRLRRPDREG